MRAEGFNIWTSATRITFGKPSKRRAFRARRYDDVLSFIALLKRSVSTVAACQAAPATPTATPATKLRFTYWGSEMEKAAVEQMVAATQAVSSGAGVLYLFGNYQGDVLNFAMAAEMAEAERPLPRPRLVLAQRERLPEAEFLLAQDLLVRG